MLEAAIQKGDLGEGGYEAWILLGDVRTMDEREDAGMRAMAQGVRLAEAAGTPGPGMLVSETRFLDCPGLLTTCRSRRQSHIRMNHTTRHRMSCYSAG